MTDVNVFISYRRDSDAPRAMLITKALEGGMRTGGFLETAAGVDAKLYMDVQDRLGVSWPERIRENLSSADIVVVVIGPEWLSARDRYYQRRIDQPDDWVRVEVETALRSDAVVVPVLFDGADMPPKSALPEAIATLSERQGMPVRTAFFDSDIQPLLLEVLECGKGAGAHQDTRLSGGPAAAAWPYPDPPLVVKPAQLSDEDVALALERMIPQWSRVESPLPEDDRKVRVELHRQLAFRSFQDVLAFMVEIGRFCDDANHHPRWENVYRTLWINLSTWDIGHRVSQFDLMLASHLDREFLRYEKST